MQGKTFAMKIENLKIFIAVARIGNINKASDELYLSHQNLSFKDKKENRNRPLDGSYFCVYFEYVNRISISMQKISTSYCKLTTAPCYPVAILLCYTIIKVNRKQMELFLQKLF